LHCLTNLPYGTARLQLYDKSCLEYRRDRQKQV
jgi:hypothetical protein